LLLRKEQYQASALLLNIHSTEYGPIHGKLPNRCLPAPLPSLSINHNINFDPLVKKKNKVSVLIIIKYPVVPIYDHAADSADKPKP